MLGSILVLILLVFLSINSRWGQNIIRKQAVSFLSEKLQTEVSIGRLNLSIPNYIELDDVFIRDRANDTLASIGYLKVEISMLKLVSSKIEIQHLELDNTYANLYRNYPDTSFNFDFIAQSFASESSTEPEQETDTTSSPINLNVDRISFNNIRFNFLDYSGGTQFKIALDSLRLNAQKTDINTFTFHVNDLMLAGVVSSFKTDTSIIPPEPETPTTVFPTIIVDNLDLSRTNFSFDDLMAPQQKEGIDFVHLDLRDVAINAEGVYYTLDSTSGKINKIAAKEKSGLDLQEFKTQFAYHTHGVYLRELYVQTSNSVLQNKLEIKYDSLQALSDRLGDMYLLANLEKSIVGLKDILIFAPDLREQDLFKNHSNEQFNLSTNIDGRIAALNINDFYLSGLDGTVVTVDGKLNGLPDADKLNYDLNIPLIKSTENDLMVFIPKDVVADINLPNEFKLTGKINGTTQDYNPDIRLVTTDGAATVKGYLHMSGGESNEQYKLYVTTEKLDIGKILKQDSVLGKITLDVLADGSSFDIEKMAAIVNGNISSLWAMGYNYQGISLNGGIDKKVGSVDVQSSDVNANFHLLANADLAGAYPTLKGELSVDSINLRAINLSTDSLALRSIIGFDIPTLNPDYPYGDITISHTGVDASNARFFIDSLFITARSSTDSGQNINVNAQFFQALLTGNIPLSKSGDFIQHQINKYYTITDTVSDSAALLDNYNINLTASIVDRPLLHTLVPSIDRINPVKIESRISANELYLFADMPAVNYNGMYVDSGKVLVKNTPDNKLNYAITMNSFSQNTLQFWYPSITGTVADNKITTDIVLKDIEKEDRFAFYASLVSDKVKQVIKLEKDLLLNYGTWNVDKENKLVLENGGMYVDKLTITHNKGTIALQSEQQNPASPLSLKISDFSISDITEILQQDTILASGLLNSELNVHNALTDARATGKLTIDQLAVMGDTIGNLNVDLKDASASEVDTRITLLGRGNDIAITGSYYAPPRNNNNLNLNVDINSLDMKSSQGLAMNNLKNSSGKITGKLALTGTTSTPLINGDIRTDSLKTTVILLGTPFTMPNEAINISDDKITLDKFTIYDDQNQKGVINGHVDITSFSDPQLDLSVKAEKWQVLNSTKEENELFYGRMLISSDLKLTGSATAPSIDGNLTIHDSTDFTLIVPEDNPAIEERKGVVKFIDKSAPDGYQMTIDKDTLPSLSVSPGTDLNLNLAIEKNALFNVVIDQASGDLLRVKGEANLNTQVNPDGTVGLAGVYVLNDGSYELNYSLVKRRFDIQEGSEIKFAGDPLNAEVDISAEYTANIPPYELVQNEIDQQNEIYYKQRLPFSVVLKLTGNILEPKVDFDITLPAEKNYRANSEVVTIVKGKLDQLRNNPSEMNKQVFAALILNKFIAADPFESLGGTSAEYVARQSASRFISAQLNRLAEEFVKGLEVNMDLQSTEDFTTGEKRNRTDLNLSATKRLFNDRLSVTVGNNFELEGAEEGNNNNSNLIPGNLAADYQLSKDGRYLVRIFRRRDNINIVEGVSVETGVSFIITLDYDRFRNLFIKNDMKKEVEISIDQPKGTY